MKQWESLSEYVIAFKRFAFLSASFQNNIRILSWSQLIRFDFAKPRKELAFQTLSEDKFVAASFELKSVSGSGVDG